VNETENERLAAPLQNIDMDTLNRVAEKIDLAQVIQVLDTVSPSDLQYMVKQLGRSNRPKQPPPVDGDFYEISDLLTPEQRELQMAYRRFMEQEVAPIINDYWERGDFPFELIPKIAQLLPKRLNGRDYEYPDPQPLLSGIIQTEIARVDPSISTFLGVHWSLCMGTIYLFGSDEQKAKWLPPMQRLEKIGSWALTEPTVGSAAAGGLLTTARQDGDSWVLNGEKKWSGNAPFADVNVIWARNVDSGQLNGFLVELNTPGYVVEKLPGKIAKRVVQNALITLDECRIPLTNRLPGVNSFADVATQLAVGRAGVAWEAVGISRSVYEKALAYSTERIQFGKPIASYQLIQDRLVQMLGNVTAMQGMMVRLAQLQMRDGGISHERASLAKVFCCQRMRETVALARGLLGGNGILLEHDVARLFADAEAVYSYEGTHEMNTLIVGRAITGQSAFV